MKTFTRRDALCGLSGSGLAALLPVSPGAVAAADAPAEKRERFVVGPFDLGDWFDQSGVKLDGLFDVGAPERKEIVKALGKCQAFVIDQRVCKDGKKARFADGKDGPKLVVAGKLAPRLEDQKIELHDPDRHVKGGCELGRLFGFAADSQSGR
jgi:hypothetical protein